MYELRFSQKSQKFLKKIKDKALIKAFKLAMLDIASNPYIGEQKRGDLAGIYYLDVYYNKTNYEIAYRIYEEDGKLVVVILVGSRENFYQELKTYMK